MTILHPHPFRISLRGIEYDNDFDPAARIVAAAEIFKRQREIAFIAAGNHHYEAQFRGRRGCDLGRRQLMFAQVFFSVPQFRGQLQFKDQYAYFNAATVCRVRPAK